MGEKEGLVVVAADALITVRAYGMKVADRIKCMTRFVTNGGYSRRGGEVFDVEIGIII
jgi:hypothetical protein